MPSSFSNFKAEPHAVQKSVMWNKGPQGHVQQLLLLGSRGGGVLLNFILVQTFLNSIVPKILSWTHWAGIPTLKPLNCVVIDSSCHIRKTLPKRQGQLTLLGVGVRPSCDYFWTLTGAAHPSGGSHGAHRSQLTGTSAELEYWWWLMIIGDENT